MQQEPIHIGCATDDQFVLYTGVMLFSLFENNDAGLFHIHVLYKPTSNDYLGKLRSLAKQYGHSLSIYKIDEEIAHNYIVNGHVSFATYYRLFFADLLDSTIKKMIYLDSDMLVLADLKPLWELEMEDHFVVAAVEIPAMENMQRLGIDLSYGYFNAGLLLMDLVVWKTRGITKKATDFIRDNPAKISFWDQDALNAVLTASWKKLPAVWNMQISDFKNIDSKLSAEIKILHFTGEHKPWSIHYKGPFKGVYSHYQSRYFLKNDMSRFFTNSRIGRLFNRL